ncbi:hypothetical protein ACIQW5_29195 [Methylorubrum thiocyanatum]|uniref:hypothetical protein n=1 Tax=Methylorubrum thiocyanatum TaxID=47958 RepID=UPI00383A95E7
MTESHSEMEQPIAPPQLLELLESICGDLYQEIKKKILDGSASVQSMSAQIADGQAIERLQKLNKTSNIMVTGRKNADFNYVGLPQELENCSFREGFDHHLRKRLGKREDGFSTIFNHLDLKNFPLIVETGCLRVPGNWSGDGQSTFQFDWYARENQGHMITIDVNKYSIDSARRACSNVTSIILNDSVAALHMLASNISRPASLLYLDSYDLCAADPMPSAIHHAMELIASSKLMGPGTIICVDDFDVPGVGRGGKGAIIDEFFHNIRANVIYSGYQKIWML